MTAQFVNALSSADPRTRLVGAFAFEAWGDSHPVGQRDRPDSDVRSQYVRAEFADGGDEVAVGGHPGLAPAAGFFQVPGPRLRP
jgi:hypothetical protein